MELYGDDFQAETWLPACHSGALASADVFIRLLCRYILILKFSHDNMNIYFTVPSNITYLYVRKKFSWDEPEYAQYSAVVSCIAGFGN